MPPLRKQKQRQRYRNRQRNKAKLRKAKSEKREQPAEEESSDDEANEEQQSSWLPALNVSAIYGGWNQAVESFKDTLFPSRRLERELSSTREKLCQVQSELNDLKSREAHSVDFSSTAPPPPPSAPPTPLPPPPPPPPPPPIRSPTNFKIRIVKGANKGKLLSMENKPRITLEDIQNVKLRSSHPMRTRSKTSSGQPLVTLTDLKGVTLRRVTRPSPRKTRKSASPEAFQLRKSLRKVNVCRSPGGTPQISFKESSGDGLTPMMTKALKRKFKNARSPSLSPHPEVCEESPALV
ncbi:proline-rich protein 11-like [Oscarella lobularis]|uniref:proline-rich protein 11-like n=1 Tax=Oscarella lobularis TaxID=121494 RepID=UPI00331330AE